jgi:hypothetical protein
MNGQAILMQTEALAAYQSLWIRVAVVSLAVLAILFAWGHVILRLAPRLRISAAPVPFACECLLNGFFAFCVTSLAGVLVGIRIPTTFWLLSACGGAAFLALHPPPSTPPADDRRTALHLWTLLVILLCSVIWSIDNLRGLLPASDGIILEPWVDAMLHARQIGDFAQFRGDLRSLNATMYGAGMLPYHYGSYLLPALVADLGNIPSIQLSTSLFPVLGIFLTGASMLVLANSIGGAGAALGAVTLLLMLPEAPSWVRGRDPLNSYAFLQQVGIGGSYAVAVMALALAHAMRSFREHSLARCLYSLALFAAAGVLFKVQILLAYGCPFFLFVLWYAPWRSGDVRLLSVVSLLALFLVLAGFLNRIPNAPNLGLSFDGSTRYLDKVLLHLHVAQGSNLVKVALLPAAVGYLLSVVFGALLPASLYLCWKLRSDLSMRRLIVLCMTSIVAVAVIRLLLEDNKGVGDIAELNRKTIVWPYYVVALCTSVLGARYVNERLYPVTRRRIAIAAPLLLLGPLVAAADGLQGRWSDSATFIGVGTPTGLFEMAAFLRMAALPNDVVQLCENDEYNALGTFSERPVFISKVAVNAHRESVEERRRFGIVRSVLLQTTYEGATAIMQEHHITWLALSPNCRVAWEAERPAEFASHGYRLYRSRD